MAMMSEYLNADSHAMEQRQTKWRRGATETEPSFRQRKYATSRIINLTIDSWLRGCDVVAVRVEDVVPSG